MQVYLILKQISRESYKETGFLQSNKSCKSSLCSDGDHWYQNLGRDFPVGSGQNEGAVWYFLGLGLIPLTKIWRMFLLFQVDVIGMPKLHSLAV